MSVNRFPQLSLGRPLPARESVRAELVARRAEEARRRGYRFLTTDARETSRPILERGGFVPLTGITGWVLRP